MNDTDIDTDTDTEIEFFQHPSSENEAVLVWGVRIDGTDLRTLVADATRELWHQELEDEFETPEEEAELVLTQHEGLPATEFTDPNHFLTPADDTPVLGCTCGIWECWPLLARITVTPTTITWSSFRQPHREEWGELRMGPYVFARQSYEAALSAGNYGH
ncbi:hypothetical protein ACFYWX_28085 [Streptomyces sp. NPDC002888]|uniref:hypothetical protein n=1 Tax=Streptomyces sp. NPDC002888 TaxID=3364668 RepID=UPI00369646CA